METYVQDQLFLGHGISIPSLRPETSFSETIHLADF